MPLNLQVPYTFGKQVTFDVVAKFLYGILNSKPSLTEAISKLVQPKWTVSVVAAMIASVMACMLSQPGDVILTETYKGADEKGAKPKTKSAGDSKSRGLAEVSTTIYGRRSSDGVIQGLSGFYTGLYARLVHVGMIITSQLIIYDLVKQLLGLPATGSH
jgi:solute carrier family 25 phosphate transporter 3